MAATLELHSSAGILPAALGADSQVEEVASRNGELEPALSYTDGGTAQHAERN